MNKSVEEIHISNLSKKRYEFIKKYNDSWDEKKEDYTIDEPAEIDELAEQILDFLKKWKNSLPVEFIIEELTKLGDAPSILYDDNGNFAVTSDGIQNVSYEDPIDMEMVFFISKDYWKSSIREALCYYLTKEEDD